MIDSFVKLICFNDIYANLINKTDFLFQDHDDNHVRKVISKCDACLLVYNVCDRYSFEYACSVARKIRQPTKSNNTWSTPILFAGNKTDLEHFR